jgi:hypothetical protein
MVGFFSTAYLSGGSRSIRKYLDLVALPTVLKFYPEQARIASSSKLLHSPVKESYLPLIYHSIN